MHQIQKSVLIVEDNIEINLLLSTILKKHNIITTSAYSGTEAELLLAQDTYDVILLDLMLPGMTGEALIGKVREKSHVPIIVISAKTDVSRKVEVLKMGADDYMTKPFDQEEVIARIEVQLRKNPQTKRNELTWRALHLDLDKRVIQLNGQLLSLTNAEYDILALFISQPEYAFSKREIYERLWTGPYVGDDNTISVHISNLRKKIAAHSPEEYIKTVWGIGFMLI